MGVNPDAEAADTRTGMPTHTSPIHAALRAAHQRGREEFLAAVELARAVEADATEAGDDAVAVRATVLRGKLELALGRIDDACATARRLETLATPEGDRAAGAALATFRAQLAFYLGAYRDAVAHSRAALTAADAHGSPELRAAVRHGLCIVLAGVEAPVLATVIHERVALADAAGDAWDRAIARNDLACLHLDAGDPDAAARALDAADAVAREVDGPRDALTAALRSTEAQILLGRGRSREAAERAVAAVRDLERSPTPHPYLLGMASVVALQALTRAGWHDDAVWEGGRALTRLADALPMTRSVVLECTASALRAAGRPDEAYDALAESIALQRRAARQFAARQADVGEAHAEAARLRDEADRDWLTGLHNRRFLARVAPGGRGGLGVVLVDLDNFKDVNDTFGHEVGDRVLTRVAQILVVAARADDTVVRLGGDEFCVVVAGADEDDAFACANRLHAMLDAEPWGRIAPGVTLGASVGYSAGPGTTPIDDLIALADRHLYGAKRGGRGRIEGTGAAA
jgi:diguanylate cyclase (GGDEF)-like protein